MTIRELIANLDLVDEDVKDYEVRATFSMQLNKNSRITCRSWLKEIPDNVDVSEKCIYLKFREE